MKEKAHDVIKAIEEAFDVFDKMELPFEEHEITASRGAAMALIGYIQRLERERDAAVEDISHTCNLCANEPNKWLNEKYPRMNDVCWTCIKNDACNWQWRGAPEVEPDA